jgi:hypothetical protein
MGRIWLCGLLAAALWWFSLHARFQPEPLGPDAPAIQFSAARADAILGRLLGAQKPHPVGSAENAAVRTRLLKELAGMGVAARTQTGMSCRGDQRWGNVACATVTNVIAGISPGAGKQVLLMAHYDSVPAGPGAGDDGSGVATLLETIRALKARGLSGEHPIVAVFTDGEEAGLLGAQYFFSRGLRAKKTGVVINMEARGNTGPSYLFQTSPGNGPLIDLYARSVPHYTTSSLYGEIYKYLPNDTDMTPALRAGVPGLNFAFIGDVAQYHTPLDRRENIPAATLQSHGENALEMADALSHADLGALKGGDELYFDILGRWLPRLKQSWALPLSLAALALIVLAGLLTRRERREIRRPYTSFLMPPLLLALAVGLGFGLHALAAWISGNADPSFAYPLWLRLSLAFGVFAAALLAATGAGPIAGWLWFAGLGVAASLWAPGIAPYFLFPTLIAAPLLLATAWGGRGPALFVAALAGLVVWLGLTAGGEQIMGLKLHVLFTVSAGFGMIALLPVLAKAPPRALLISCGASLLLALVFSVVAGLQPAFSATAPQRLNIRYIETGAKGWWVTDAVPHLPDSLRAAANFSARPERKVDFGYVAPADRAHLPAPQVKVARDGSGVTLNIHSEVDRFLLEIPQAADMTALSVNGAAVTPPTGQPVTIICTCRDARLVMALGDGAATLPLRVIWPGLASPDGAKLQKARPSWAVPSQVGDVSVLATDVAVPAR